MFTRILPWLLCMGWGIVLASATEPEDRWKDAFQILHFELKKSGLTEAQLKPFQVDHMRYLSQVVDSKMLNIVWDPGDYTQFYNQRGVRETAKFIRQQAKTFHRVERETGVAQSVIAAIMWVETGYGRNTGRHSALNTLASLAALKVPTFGHGAAGRIEQVAERRDLAGREKIDWPDRAKKVGERWFQELQAFLILAEHLEWNVDEVNSSWAGALGYGQFMPLTALETLKQGATIRKANLWAWEDTIEMIALYLNRMGWKKGASWEKKKQAVFRYNNSRAYVNAVITLSARAEQELKKK